MANSSEILGNIDSKILVTTDAMENFIKSTYERGSHPALNKNHLANGLYNLINNPPTNDASTQHGLDDIFATDTDIDGAFSN